MKIPRQIQGRMRGQAMVEYLLVTSAVALVLFLPLPADFYGDPGGTPDRPPAERLAVAFRDFFRGFSFFVSVL